MPEKIDQVDQEMDDKVQGSPDNPDSGELIAESKKYRTRAQKAEQELARLNQEMEDARQKQLEKQNEWKTLAEERKTKLDELTPVVEQYKASEAKFKDELLQDFAEDDRETFKELSVDQLRAVHNKLISKKTTLQVDGSSPSGQVQGYSTASDAAVAFSKGEIDKSTFEKIKTGFRQRFAN